MTAVQPTLFLTVADRAGKKLDEPYFAALSVTSAVVARLRRLARLCETHRIAWLATVDCPPPYWHTSDDRLTDERSTWHVVGTVLYVELSARRRVEGGYGELEVIGQTAAIDLAELVHMRKHRIVLDFREHDGQYQDGDEPFALEVVRRLRHTGVWPQLTRMDDDSP